MLINPHTSILHQWKQKQSILDQLQEIASLPITSSSHQRDTLEKEFIEFIFQNDIDFLFGGLLVDGHTSQLTSSRQKYYKPTITNIYLAEILIAADQVFYHGIFSFVGNQIIGYLIREISNGKNNLLDINRFTDLNNSDCFFSLSVLKDLLEDKEFHLLIALTSPSSIKEVSSEDLLLSYTRSLREAAENIDMHYKEAQIVEFSLLNKLKTNKFERDFSSSQIENGFVVNCELLALLSKHLINGGDASSAKLAIEIFHGLHKQLLDDSVDANDLVSLIHAGIMLLQIDFDLDLVVIIDKLTLQLAEQSTSQKTNEKSEYQEMVIKLFQQRKNAQSNPSKIQLLFLSRQQIDLDARLMDLRAKFNPCCLVFIV